MEKDSPLRSHLFVKGDPNHPSKVGTNNYKKVQRFFQSIIEDKEYQECFRLRAIAGKLAPMVEAKMYEYVAGKPKDSLDRVMGSDPAVDLAQMSSADLAARREEFSRRLLERKRLKEQADAQRTTEEAQRDGLGVAHAS